MSSNFNNTKDAPYIIALCRVSTEKQARLSLKLQDQRIRAWATAMGYRVLDSFSDACSGRKAMRSGLETAINLAVEHKAIIVTYDSSRLFRNARHMLNTFDLLEANGAAYASVTEPLMDTRNGSASAKLIRTIFGAVGEFFAAQSGEKVAAQNAATVAERKCKEWPKGYRTNGAQPVGWMLDENGYRIPCQEELDILEKIRQAYAQCGYKNRVIMRPGRLRSTAALLTEWGVPTISEVRARRNGRENRCAGGWTFDKVRRFVYHFNLNGAKKKRKKAKVSNETT